MDQDGSGRDTPNFPAHGPRHLYGVPLWDDHGSWRVRRADSQWLSNQELPRARKRYPQVVAKPSRLVVAGRGAGGWKPVSIPGKAGIYLCRPNLVNAVVVGAVDLLVKPPEAIPHLGLELAWGLDRHGLDTLKDQQLNLPEAVAGITATIKDASMQVITSTAELAGMPRLSALVLGEVGGAAAAVMVAPLVTPLKLGAETINVVSMLLPAGDPRAWASMNLAKGWTEQAVIHGLNHYLEPWSSLVSLGAGIGLLALVAASPASRLGARSPVNTGLDAAAWDDAPRGLDQPSTVDADRLATSGLQSSTADRLSRMRIRALDAPGWKRGPGSGFDRGLL